MSRVRPCRWWWWWWLLGVMFVQWTAQTPLSPSTVVSSTGRTPSISGYNVNTKIDFSKKIHRTHKYHRELFTSNIAKWSSTTTNYTKVNTIGKVLYKRRYSTTASRFRDFTLNRGIKRIPLMCSCAMSKRSSQWKPSNTIKPNNNMATSRITTVAHIISNNISLTKKMTEKDLYRLTSSPLSTRVDATNQTTFTNRISFRNQSTMPYFKDDTSTDPSDLKGTISHLKLFSSSVRTTEKKRHTVRHSNSKTKTNTDNYHKISNHPSYPVLLTHATKKRKYNRYTKRHSINSMVSTDDLMCSMCSKPVLPIHTLIKTKPSTTIRVSVKSSQKATTMTSKKSTKL